MPFLTSHTDVEARYLADVLPENAVVLEAGCGRRSCLGEHRHRIERLVGVDLDAAAEQEDASVDEFVGEHLDRPGTTCASGGACCAREAASSC